MKLPFSIIFFLVLIPTWGSSQEMLGTIHSNYSGVYGVGINPSLMVTSKLYFDVNLFSVQGFLDNDYAYLSRDEFVGILRDREIPQYYTEEQEERPFAIYRDRELYSGYQNLKITGPGAMIVNGKHAFGFTTSFRSMSAFRNMPKDVAVFIYEAIDYENQHNITYSHDKPILAGSLSWFELGLSYALNFHRYKWSYWSAGITVKPLFGSAGAYTAIDQLTYKVINDTTANVSDASFNFGIAVPVNYTTNEVETKPFVRGFGFGLDVGVTYQYTTKGHSSFVYSRICEQPYEDYNFRIGVSLLDLGYIKFKKAAIYEDYSHVNAYWFKPDDIMPDSSINTLVDKVDYYFNGNGGEVNKNDNFVMYLPPAISLQADINLGRRFYFNTSAMLSFRISKQSIYRPSIISFAPRYESARWEVSIPVSVYAYHFEKPRIGLAFRYGNFFAGADRLNTLSGLSDFTGIDAYVGLRLNLSNLLHLNFIKGNCGFKKAKDIETFDFRNF